MASDPDVLTILNSLLHDGGIEGYISFFRKRIDMEEEYQASLAKLASRQHDLERRLYGEPHQHLFHDQAAPNPLAAGEPSAAGSERSQATLGPGSGSGGGPLSSAPGSANSYVGGPDSVRQAWRELTGNVAHESALRREWIKHLRDQVLEPLEKFRHSKERTLSRIRDDLRSSFADHKEYSGTVVRLKKTYERKCDEVHQLYAMQEAVEYRDKVIEETSRAVSTAGLSRSGDDWEHVEESPTNSEGSSAGVPLVRRKSGDGYHSSNPASPPSGPSLVPSLSRSHPQFIISGATSIALKDTATPSPGNPLQARGNDVLHALRSNTNNLIQRLNSRKDKQSGASSSAAGSSSSPVLPSSDDMGGTKSSAALRIVKARRDAEDADRDYRKGVFHLDTLRLRKEQVIRGARRAAEEMIFEMAGEAKEAFGFFIDETRIASMKRVSICDHAQHLVDKITPDEDAARFAALLPKDYTEPKVLYENAFTGQCRSLLFGVALTDYVASNPNRGLVPLIVKRCVDEIERRGKTLEGIYRISGKMQGVTRLVHEIEKDEDAFRFDEQRHDAYTISGVLKLYLRQLPTPLFTFPLADRIAFSNNLDEHSADGYGALVRRIRKLPPSHQATLKLICAHLARVAACSEENKMPVSNLGLVFAPAVFSEEGAQALPSHPWKDSVMEVLISRHEELFEGLPLAEPSTPHRGGRTSFGTGRPASPAARKSLEAERYESYSRSVSPSRGHYLDSEAMERQRSLKAPVPYLSHPHPHPHSSGPASQSVSPLPSPSHGPSGTGYRSMMGSPQPPPIPAAQASSGSLDTATTGGAAAPMRRKFSLRKKSGSGSSPTDSQSVIRERPETILIPGPAYVSAAAAAAAVAGGNGQQTTTTGIGSMVTSPTSAGADFVPPSLPPGAMPPTPPGESGFATPRTSITKRDRAASDLAAPPGRSATGTLAARKSAEQLAAATAGTSNAGGGGLSQSPSASRTGVSSSAGAAQKRAASD